MRFALSPLPSFICINMEMKIKSERKDEKQAEIMHKTNTFSYTLITSFEFTELCVTPRSGILKEINHFGMEEN